jgi:nucleotide-binding universal stress UspA family protein
MQPFRTILCGADFSENSKEAFHMACALAVEDKTRLFVLYVVEPDWVAKAPRYLGQWVVPSSATESLHGFLKRQMADVYVPIQPLDVECRTSEGDPAEQILRLAEKIGADLIVMGTHGRTGLRRLLTGSVATAVLRGARCPVLALRCLGTAPTAEGIRVILHPTDSSDVSEAALRVAQSLARELGAKLVLLSVLPFAVLFNELAVTVDPQEYRAALERVGKHLDSPDLKYPVETRLVQGDAADEILRTAREIGCDLIVMGTHGRTGLSRFLMGRVAESVLRKADSAVMVVKPHQGGTFGIGRQAGREAPMTSGPPNPPRLLPQRSELP